jgi:NADH-quinone oxidoreductase subunit E
MKKARQDIDVILKKYPRHPQHLISLLQDVQAEFRYVSPEHLTLVCDHLRAPLTQAWAAVTFYKSFSLEPGGEHVIKVCLGTTCHLKGGTRIAEACERDLGVQRGQTTEDLRFTLDTVKCVGACALAPVVVIDQDYLGEANMVSVKERLEKLDSAAGGQDEKNKKSRAAKSLARGPARGA